MTVSPLFVIPHLGIETLGLNAFSFNRAAAETMRLGVYVPGEPPIVFNVGLSPVVRHGTELGVYVHENTHQNLMLNTSFGLLTQLLSSMRNVTGPEPYTACYEEQWGVQELDATYAELFAIATAFPNQFDDTRRGLPSRVLNQLPYRELFDSMSLLLPLAPTVPREVAYAQYVTVHAVACCSMSSDCLASLPGSELEPEQLIEHIRTASPNVRFNRIVWELLEKDALKPIVEVVAGHIDSEYLGRSVEEMCESPFPEQDCFSIALECLLRHLEHTAVHPESRLVTDMQAAHAALAEWYRRRSRIREIRVFRQEESQPIYLDSPEYHALLREKIPGRTSTARLESLFANCRRDNLGVALTLSLKDTQEAWVSTHPYILAEPPNPMVGSPPEGTPPLPNDLALVVRTDELLAVLQQFPSLPHVVKFIRGSWRDWDAIPNAMQIFANKVRVCFETNLSEPHLQELLMFEDLHEGAQVILVSTSKDDLLTGVFTNDRRPGVYAIQRVPRGPGVDAFLRVTERLGIGSPKDQSEADRLVPHSQLLAMIAGF